jgi:hypothetical protein
MRPAEPQLRPRAVTTATLFVAVAALTGWISPCHSGSEELAGRGASHAGAVLGTVSLSVMLTMRPDGRRAPGTSE